MSSAYATGLARANAVYGTAFAHAQSLSTKMAGNIAIGQAGGGVTSGFDNYREQAAQRQRYGMFHGWLYAAINALASEAAGQPLRIAKMLGALPLKPDERGRQISLTKAALHKAPRDIQNKAANQELEMLVDHPWVTLFEQPNPIQSWWQFVYCFVANLNLTGWAYVIGGINEETKKEEFYSLPTTWIRPDHKEGPFSRFYITDPSKPTDQNQEPLTRENVAFAHLPNPANPFGAMAPAQGQMMAIRIDDHIQTSQEAFFENGIFPSVVVTIGKDPHPDVPGGGTRPRLNGTQRRQVVGAIRKAMGGIASYGNPAIVDGLIESITRLSATQNEMGWDKSEDKVATRILSAFAVHKYILGDAISIGGYAQAAKIEERFYKRVNTFTGMLGMLLTNFSAIHTPERLKLWIEQCTPNDPSLHWSNVKAARAAGDVSRNEIRVMLNLPPDESGGDRNHTFTSADVTAILETQKAVKRGDVLPAQAVAIYTIAYDLGDEDATALAGPLDYVAPVAPDPFDIPGENIPPAFGKPEPKPKPKPDVLEEATDTLKSAILLLRNTGLAGSLPAGLIAGPIVDAIYKSNDCHNENGQFCEGSGGGGAGGDGYARVRDRIEGTQVEADNEVKKAAKGVKKAKEALAKFEAKVETAVAKATFKVLENRLSEIKANIDDLQTKKASSDNNIADLKAQLAAMRKRKEVSTEEDVLRAIEDEADVQTDIVKQAKIYADAVDLLIADIAAAGV